MTKKKIARTPKGRKRPTKPRAERLAFTPAQRAQLAAPDPQESMRRRGVFDARLIGALTGDGFLGDPTEIVTLALELGAAEARAISDLSDGSEDDTQAALGRALAGRLEALRTFVSEVVDWDADASAVAL